MNKININVPDYVNYISEWTELQIPTGHFIMDKTITGCGFTEYFLTNQQNVVLCSPRKVLLENKEAQHHGVVFYAKNEVERSPKVDHDINLTKPGIKEFMAEFGEELGFSKVSQEEEEKRKKHIVELKNRISDYIDDCGINKKPFKILVTYDSLKHVLEVLKNKFTPQAIDTIQFVVDEFQSIFSDARFKGHVELDFLDFLQDCNNVCYLSATPMIEKYLDRIEEFKNLPYYKLVWSSDKVVKAKIIRKRVKSIIDEAGNIILRYRSGTFPRKILEDKSIHESKEVVFYVNSVKTICSIIRKYGLTPAETNIICSRDDKNKRKLRAVKHDFGEIPLSPSENKMFTFCTRTVYLGADFYSHSAYTVVCSDCTVETLSVDIKLDLPQILGRQRLKSNVFRNECLLFYKVQKFPISKKMFDRYLEIKRNQTNNLISIFGSLDGDKKISFTNKMKEGLILRYSTDFVSISSKTGRVVYNNLVELSEERAWEVSQEEYQDDITVRRILEEDYHIEDLHTAAVSEIKELNTLLNNFLEEFNNETWFEKKMKLYCDFLDQYYSIFKTTNLPDIPREFQNYVNLLGVSKVRSLGYRKVDLENEYNIVTSQDKIKKEVIKNFEVGKRYITSNLKQELQNLYDSFGLKKKAKATDLGEYFEIEIVVNRISGKNVRCINILKIKY